MPSTDTIAAISTPLGTGGLGIIRVSGPKAFSIARSIFSLKGRKFSPGKLRSHTIHMGFLKYRGKKIDEALMGIFRRPHSYTGEDTVEFTCHGGILVLESALNAVIETGKARLAEQGEFTRMAFLNRRLDLIQAEAVADIIGARTGAALDSAVSQLDGRLSEEIRALKEDIVLLLSSVEARIEFPEDTAERTDGPARAGLRKGLRDVMDRIRNLLRTYETGALLRQGVNVIIAGAPNTGKSTLLNALLGFERAIVTPVAGTTRDFLKESVIWEGNIVNLTDTAGIRKAENEIEEKGISLTEERISESNIAIHLVDGSRPPGANDRRVHEKLLRVRDRVLVVNKADRPLHRAMKAGLFGAKRMIFISAKYGTGIEKLKNGILDILKRRDRLYMPGKNILSSVRHKNSLERSLSELGRAGGLADEAAPEEIISHHLKAAADALDCLTGATTPDDVINLIFSRFCIGK